MGSYINGFRYSLDWLLRFTDNEAKDHFLNKQVEIYREGALYKRGIVTKFIHAENIDDPQRTIAGFVISGNCEVIFGNEIEVVIED